MAFFVNRMSVNEQNGKLTQGDLNTAFGCVLNGSL